MDFNGWFQAHAKGPGVENPLTDDSLTTPPRVLREIVITDPDGNSLTPVAFQSFEECPFPEEIKEEAGLCDVTVVKLQNPLCKTYPLHKKQSGWRNPGFAKD